MTPQSHCAAGGRKIANSGAGGAHRWEGRVEGCVEAKIKGADGPSAGRRCSPPGFFKISLGPPIDATLR